MSHPASWDNNTNGLCTNVFQALPSANPKCNCQLVNTTLAMPPLLTLVKNVINDNGGTAGVNDFGLTIGGVGVTSGLAELLQLATSRHPVARN